MVLANEEAMRLKNDYIDTGHILVGLISEGPGVAANVLTNLELDLHKIRQGVEKLVQSDHDSVNMEIIQRKPRAKKVIEYSMEEARNLNRNYVGTEHILLGLLRETDGLGAKVIIQLRLRLEDIRREVLVLLGRSGG
jgi:ATP-dependent Clp protease ATP-binding subunit ClpC